MWRPISQRGYATNPFGIKLLPEAVRSQLFLKSPNNPTEKNSPDQVKKALASLRQFDLKPEVDLNAPTPSDSFPIELPPLYGDVESHFYKIALQQVQPYQTILKPLLQAPILAQPSNWVYESGWTRYAPNRPPEKVNYPLELCFSFDVEVCVQDGHHPVMATALTDQAWYGWCSPHLIHGTKPSGMLTPDDLIPISDPRLSQHRLVIGHNVSYDRARCGTEYLLSGTDTRFLDTMSMHIVVNGMTSGQRMMKAKYQSQENSDQSDSETILPKWVNHTALNSLRDVYQFYCKGQLAKDDRNVFVKGTLKDIQDDFQNLMTYCATDVMATLKVLRALYPMFQDRCPHPVSFSGMLEMGSAFLPISPRWEHYLKEANETAFEVEQEMHTMLARQTEEAVQLARDHRFEQDMWLWDQDWSCPKLRFKLDKRKKGSMEVSVGPDDDRRTQLRKKFCKLFGSAECLAKTQPKKPGYPKWFQDLCERSPNSFYPVLSELTPSKKIVPKILRLKWMGYPVHRHETHKWGYIMPSCNDHPLDRDSLLELGENVFPMNQLEQSLTLLRGRNQESDLFISEPPDFPPDNKPFVRAQTPDSDMEVILAEIPGGKFVHLPHKNGKGNNVGNPLSKDFLTYVKEGILSTDCEGQAAKILLGAKSCAYWKSNQDRITGQMVVQSEDHGNIILPMIVSAGTLTRRAVERTWLTASNARPDRIGSEFKALVEAPPGYRLVGADVDSQELWIAAVLGDANSLGEHGCTPLGWMTLQGTKAAGTDMHSVTAKTVGISRDNAKILNYGRIYGAGLAFASTLLKQFNPSLDDAEAKRLASLIYVKTKGRREYQLNAIGAKCKAIWLKTKGHTDLEATFKESKGQLISRQEFYQLVRIRNKWKYVVEKELEEDSLYQLSPEGQDLALNFLGHTNETANLTTIADLIISMGSMNYESAHELDFRAIQKEICSRLAWVGGTESEAFNRLEGIALSFSPKTPVLGCKISKALESAMVGSDFLPSRINWVVQSSAVDYLHLLLTSMKWLITEYDIQARFVISIHDEVRYLVHEDDIHRAALALQISNVLVRAMFASRLNMNSLPESVAFFSCVDLDRVLRKDPFSDCVTPSNPQGLALGHGIPPGEGITIHDLVRLSNLTCLSSHSNKQYTQ